ncbi:low temperature requirement protein A [Herbiconiux sp. CPCC 205763]|uniref:Low temperature requirement protein A n=1 Tax=Herbiconiux aconitum TaxID=2970913 RepID=A0ABT2GQB6_9MICO|nr:low temperature requirement protein A [Herbiconiux aconitum]MCS5718420.1 low temperature requirement protein A [Herbiconiux aconitum]
MADATPATNRRVDWLELFFDLVFVVIIKQITDLLHGDPDVADFVLVGAILVPVWAAWLNVTTFVNRAGDSSTGARLSILVSMAGVALIAISIPEVMTSGAPLFALGYALARLAVWPVWAAQRRREGGGILQPTVYGPGLAALWLASIAVPDAYRPWVWAALVLVEGAIFVRGIDGTDFVAGHIIERVGLFTMIVLGEAVVELILSVRIGQSAAAWLIAALGFALICSFWWMYFQSGTRVTERVLGHSSSGVIRDVLAGAHYLIVLGLIGVAAGLGGAVEQADHDHLQFSTVVALSGGTALYHGAQVLTAWRYGLPMRLLAAWGVLSLATSAVVIVFGVAWAPWVVVLVMLVDSLLHAATGPIVARRVRAG